jgi:hypothetical protein
MNDESLLKFGHGNAYLDKRIATFSIPSGWTCPGALKCLAKADRTTGKITDGPQADYRCYQVNCESIYPSLRKMVWHNFDLLRGKTRDEMAELILVSLPPRAEIIRVHVGGDFFNEAYFLAWCDVARVQPAICFYAFTKSIPFWAHLESLIPPNLILTASEGGRYDDQIGDRKMAKVVFSEAEAVALGLPIDCDDRHAYSGTESFALLLHGQQPKGSVAAQAVKLQNLKRKLNKQSTAAV